jgi:hypothetical protein
MVVTADFDPGPGTSTVPAHSTTTTVPGPGSQVSAIPGDSLTGTTNSTWPVVLWSALTLLIAVLVWFIWRRSPTKFRWLIVIVGVPAVLACLLVAFEHISLALPGSF